MISYHGGGFKQRLDRRVSGNTCQSREAKGRMLQGHLPWDAGIAQLPGPEPALWLTASFGFYSPQYEAGFPWISTGHLAPGLSRGLPGLSDPVQG